MARSTAEHLLSQTYEQHVTHDGPTDVAMAMATIAANDTLPVQVDTMFGAAMVAANQRAKLDKLQQDAVEADRIEALKILGQDELNLGDLNPLIHAPNLGRKESVDAVRHITLEKIRQHGGILPHVFESTIVVDPETGDAAPRLVARFEVSSLTEEQLVLLEQLVEETYGYTVRTRTDSKGNDIPPQSYPPTQPGEEMRSKTGGWYMGPAPVPNSSLHQGLFVFRDLGQINKDNFLSDHESAGKYIVEIREASQYQTDIVTFITQVATVLGQDVLPNRGELLYESYYDLIRLGLKKADEESIYGMDEAADMIRRELIIPLASPEISAGVRGAPQSVLMIGVPGTGKTLIVERLLQEETGIFVLPIDPFALQKELAQPKEKQTLMPRIAEIARVTGKRVVLHVDDIENMVGEKEVTNSTMLNLMAGVQESGFHIIASTNYPEKINPSLIQPERFSVLIHCGLQNEQARLEILKIHADMQSKDHKIPLFASEEIRDIILGEIARNKHTANFTPRFLANIATIAKSHLVDRVARDKGVIIGLTEADLAGYTYITEDWERALAEVAEKYDSKATEKRDEEMKRFVKKHTESAAGFTTNILSSRRIFSVDVIARVAAAEALLQSANQE